jgi:hypothetical protein
MDIKQTGTEIYLTEYVPKIKSSDRATNVSFTRLHKHHAINY